MSEQVFLDLFEFNHKGFPIFKKCAEVDITNYTAEQFDHLREIEERYYRRTWEIRRIPCAMTVNA